MTTIWVLVVAMCMTENKQPVKCSVDHGTKAFTSERECKEYATKHYNPAPDCFAPVTVFYEREKEL